MGHKIRSLTYPQLVVLGYLVIITMGTVLLSFPMATRSNVSVGFVDALFTATSATCVTGLVVYDTFTHWSLFGQIVIMTLIQIGGLGFMAVITMFSFFLRRRIGLKERGLLRESVNSMYLGGVVLLIKRLLIGTFLFEGFGAVILSARFVPQMGLTTGIYNGIFHSVSAFNNAGFDLMGKYGKYSSLISYAGDPVVTLTIMGLIIVGGIGFFVWDDILKHRHRFKEYQLHTKIVFAITSFLITWGAIVFFLFERTNLLNGLPFGEKILVSLFSAVTPRTAGFSVVDMGVSLPGTRLLTMILMFIGGSPGSTAGGIKTTTFAALVISAWSSLKNTKGDSVFGRQLEESALRRANTVVVINLTLVLVSSLVISATKPVLPLGDVVFETVSALSTVGLSTGITGSLGIIGQLMLILLMYTGRVGSISLALLFMQHRMPVSIQKPTEKIIIG